MSNSKQIEIWETESSDLSEATRLLYIYEPRGYARACKVLEKLKQDIEAKLKLRHNAESNQNT